MATCNWKGVSGFSYAYEVLSLNSDWNDVAGNYIFARTTSQGWIACYIGETDSFKNRLPNHEKRPCAVGQGATHIHAHVNKGGQLARKAEEADLIPHYRPPCNDHLK
jgi:hypothetical protein